MSFPACPHLAARCPGLSAAFAAIGLLIFRAGTRTLTHHDR